MVYSALSGLDTVTNKQTPWNQVFPEEPAVVQLLKNVSTFYGTKSF
jgi:hypothetical protein